MSSPLILSQPLALPQGAQDSNWEGLSFVWSGWDGSVWDLTDPAGGVALLLDGVEGLHNPKLTRYTSQSRAVPGNRLRGWRANARDVFWPVLLWADGSDGWRERNNDFWSTIHPDKPGVWTVGAGESSRSLLLTGVFDDAYAYEHDPFRKGWAEYPVPLEAAQPYWEGEEIVRGPWRTADPASFFPGPPFTISSGAAFGAASIPNPGDVEAYGVWWVRGPLSSIELGVGSTAITVPFSVAAGKMLRIDTDPRRPTATLGNAVDYDDLDDFTGTDQTSALGLQSYAAVPPGAKVNLHVEGTGSGEISFHLRPLYFRAF